MISFEDLIACLQSGTRHGGGEEEGLSRKQQQLLAVRRPRGSTRRSLSQQACCTLSCTMVVRVVAASVLDVDVPTQILQRLGVRTCESDRRTREPTLGWEGLGGGPGTR